MTYTASAEESAATSGEAPLLVGNDGDDMSNDRTSPPVVELEDYDGPPVPVAQNQRINNNAPETATRCSKPLAFSSTTPLLVKLCLPILILATHGLFWYGQTRPMWRLTQAMNVDGSVNATGTQARIVLDALQLPHDHVVQVHESKNVKTFTYAYAIQELWRAKAMPGKFLPRLAAVLLAIFSGIWPHLKLIMLQAVWFGSRQPKRRHRALASLSVLGKWSLTDVLVVCVMVGVLNLSWTFTATKILASVKTHWNVITTLVHSIYSATDLCSQALHYSCVDPSKFSHKLQCATCREAVNNLFKKPDYAQGVLDGLETSGGGTGELYVAGLHGIYAFCGAVICSILLSLLVDWYHHVARRALNNALSLPDHDSENANVPAPEWTNGSSSSRPNHHASWWSRLWRRQTSLSATDTDDDDDDDDVEDAQDEISPILIPRDPRSAADRALDASQLRRKVIKWSTGLAITMTLLVLLGTTVITLQRNVNGALPLLLHDILGVEWSRSYSLVALTRLLGYAGGWDVMLAGTFCLFIVLGPLVRAMLCIFALVRPLKSAQRISTAIDFIGAFCAWEVLLGAVFMVDLLMPSITSTIVMDDRCAQLTHDATCLQVEFSMLRTFGFVLVGGAMQFGMSWFIRWQLR